MGEIMVEEEQEYVLLLNDELYKYRKLCKEFADVIRNSQMKNIPEYKKFVDEYDSLVLGDKTQP